MLGQVLLEDQSCRYARYCAELLACTTDRALLDQSVNGNCRTISTVLVEWAMACVLTPSRIVEPIKGQVELLWATRTDGEQSGASVGPDQLCREQSWGSSSMLNSLCIWGGNFPQSESEESSRIFAGHESIAAGALACSFKLSTPALTSQSHHHHGDLWMF
jgi:hypothetical protein